MSLSGQGWEYATTLDRLRKKHHSHTIDFIDQSADKQTLIYLLSNAYDPGFLMKVDTQTMEEEILAQYRKDLPSDKLGLVASVKYKARDGAKIPAFVTVPPALDGKDIKNYSPTNRASEMKIPTFLAHATDDQAVRFLNILK